MTCHKVYKEYQILIQNNNSHDGKSYNAKKYTVITITIDHRGN